jgi:hypothetical protein
MIISFKQFTTKVAEDAKTLIRVGVPLCALRRLR